MKIELGNRSKDLHARVVLFGYLSLGLCPDFAMLHEGFFNLRSSIHTYTAAEQSVNRRRQEKDASYNFSKIEVTSNIDNPLPFFIYHCNANGSMKFDRYFIFASPVARRKWPLVGKIEGGFEVKSGGSILFNLRPNEILKVKFVEK